MLNNVKKRILNLYDSSSNNGVIPITYRDLKSINIYYYYLIKQYSIFKQ
jgi:cytochrome c